MGRLARQWQSDRRRSAGCRATFPSLFPVGIGQDDKDPNRYVPGLGQGGLGMPNRDYYLKSDEASAKEPGRLSRAYRGDAASDRAFPPARPPRGRPRSTSSSASWPRRIGRSPTPATRRRPTIRGRWPSSKAKAPGFDWQAYLDAAPASAGRPTFIVGETSAVTGDGQASSRATPLPVLRTG